MAAPPAASEFVEEAYRVWNESGPQAFVGYATEDVELHDAPDLPDAQVWVGRDAVVARLEDVVAATGGRWADIDEIRPAGEEVLVALTWRIDRAGPPLACVYHRVLVNGDRIARVRVYLDQAAATDG
jgi:ketosteroid isomerase-like protein